MTAPARSVCVVGGGLAGITAALRLADAGLEVTLLESRARLGGLTHSFQRDGLWVDNGQHVFMRCCTAYLQLLDRLGVRHLTHLQDRLDVPVASELTSATTRLSRNNFPAPLQLSGALLRHRWMPWSQRALVGAVALGIGRLDRTDPAVDDQSFGAWLRGRGVSDRAIEVMWELIGKATLNAGADDSSLALAATVFQVGMLADKSAADLGWSDVPLQHLHGDPAVRALDAAGVFVRTRSKVTAVGVADDRIGLETGDGPESFDEVVLAVPPTALQRILDPTLLGLPADVAERLGAAPIVNLHLVLDRPVMDTDFVAAVDSPLQWVFDRTEQSGLTEGQYLAVSLSAADDLIGHTNAQLRAWAMPHLCALLPRLADADVRDFFVTREPEATFRQAPGSGRQRAVARTAARGVFLAGAWTATGWPATMEGAVRSGNSAAEAILAGPLEATSARTAARNAAPIETTRSEANMSDLRTVLEQTRTLVTPALHKAVDSLDGQERLVVAYHLGFVDTAGDPVTHDGGKGLRPTLVLLGGQAVGIDPAQVVGAAVAVELVHNFSLVHDDIMDRDRTRRHRPTVWAVWDDATAILAGDAMQTLAFETLLGDPSPHAAAAAHLLATTTRELIHGQVLDMEFEQRERVSLADCRAMAAAKTGVLLACSAAVPAVLAGGTHEQRAALTSYGRHVGAAFQLVDDLLGIWGDPEVTGKSNHSDLRAKKRSLPISWALEQPGSGRVQDWLVNGPTDDDTIAGIAAHLADIGARDWCRSSADTEVAAALEALHQAQLDPAAVAGLTEVAHYVAGREA
ncbi:hydroxysqualene dehydroxylase HpnE [Flexivirga meconopsidis]|uniref:hydroxysqualene dehydroxylase HpnE n=1 Tax=Flexivirga meconopsidis TaxID=2977121 RepID=UPI00244911AA|nr:hydroxysqualene dehydroxylase HpnE [Flexivirga meconopsidis]